MSKLSRSARLYILSVIGLGLVVIVWELARLPHTETGLLLAVSAVAAVAQTLKVEGPTERSSYNLSWVAYGFALLVWGTAAALAVIVIAHVVEWIRHRYPWYIQSFNIGSYALTIFATGLAYQTFTGGRPPTDFLGLAGILAAAATFTGLNHLFIGAVLKLARGQSFLESGVFDRLPLIIDFTLFGVGAMAALIWQFNPFAALLAAIPLYLIYLTLRVPALQRQTQLDPKTGLFNAKYFEAELEKELARADRYDRPLTVVVGDLDLLRNINNTYGHLAGDAALLHVAKLLKAGVRDYDVVARFGGEEFAILMPETTLEQAEARLEEIREAIETAQIDIATSVTPIRVTMSFGIASRTRFGQKPSEIIHSADLAVYQAKLTGRNRVCRYAGSSDESPETKAPHANEPVPEAAPPAHRPAAPAAANAERAKAHTPAPATLPTIKPRPAWALSVYILTVVSAALLLLAWSWPATGSFEPDWTGLALFAVMVFLAEWLALDIYVRDTSISTAAAPLLAGVMLFGPVGAIVMSVTLAGAAMLKHRSPANRFLFNAANHLISGLLAAGVFRLTDFGNQLLWLQLSISLVAASLVYLSSTLLVSIAMDLSSGQPFHRLWLERFRWLWPYYLALGILASTLAGGYLSYGLAGVLVTLVPLLMLRYSQVQYIDHTTALVAQLRQNYSDLQTQAQQISTLNEELLLALSQATDLRDPDVNGHSQNVARYAVLIAQELGLQPERVELVRKAALLHDIGKLGIPESILFKPARLNAQEYRVVKLHATLGADIVESCQSLRSLAPFIRHHHERFDGKGYPAGLPGPKIPLEARILSLADTVEAMASDRPYRPAQTPAAILAEIQKHSGTQFDPLVVGAFVRVIQRDGENIIVNSSRSLAAQATLVSLPQEALEALVLA
jgi:diguanylate cyclase (GGDEF)-like protein/putative nucleotidyltransferase with HDIG domain